MSARLSATGYCVGTTERKCGAPLDPHGGRIRCNGCRIEQSDIDKRARNRITNQQRKLAKSGQ